MKQTEIEREIDALIRPVAEELGINIVLITLDVGTLHVLAENPATGTLGLDDCAAFSRKISPILEEVDPIPGAYRLEVGSPGIERPLVKAEDFKLYAGFDAKIELDIPQNGQKRFQGKIIKEENGIVVLNTPSGEKELPLHAIHKARLVLTDELLKWQKSKITPPPAFPAKAGN